MASASFLILKKPIAPADDGVAVFIAPDGQLALDVKVDAETVWLTQEQLSKLFQRDVSVVSRHIRNLFKDKELDQKSNLQKVQFASSDKPVTLYSLDVILSVGYRVNSRRGTQFRIWATNTLHTHLLKGFTVNERRLRQRTLGEMQETLDLLYDTLTNQTLVSDEGAAVLQVVKRYSRCWELLLEYDEDRLPETPRGASKAKRPLPLQSARRAIAELKQNLAQSQQSSPLFGIEREQGLERILGAIEQTFDRKPLYPTAQARAAHLLYFIIKDHPFTDGNKRIGSLLFLEYLRLNGLLHKPSGQLLVDQRALVAIALLIAESNPKHKDLLIRLVSNLLAVPLSRA